MKLLVLYLLLLKATATSFSGLSSLPVLREDLVVRHQMLSDAQLNLAVTAGRSGPGPNGLYVVSVGYLIGGLSGAVAGWLAMITPTFLVIPLVRFVGARADRPRLRSAIRASMTASAGLLLAATLPLARGALTDGVLIGVAAGSFLLFAFTRLESVWVVAAAAAAGLVHAAVVG
ncbi:MAG: chromate transporter [Candidatus Rokuibacteriota bacterium]|nr:MAG: chromate transporter [Candidatus Rokubacteria bacterium]